MKIEEVTEDHILFDNGNKIEYGHDQDCCEWKYACFKILGVAEKFICVVHGWT